MLDRGAYYSGASLWNRQAYIGLFREKKITAVVRMRDRSDPGHKNHIPSGVPLAIRFIKDPSVSTPAPTPERPDDRLGDLFPDEGITFERTECIVKQIQYLTMDDLRGCSPDTGTPELVRYHLALVNNTELPSWDTVVTIWKFKYLPNVTE